MIKRFIIAAGGTGGHIIPALSIFETLAKENHVVRFLCRKKDLDIVPQLKEIKKNLIFLPGKGLKRKLTLTNLVSFFYVFYGFFLSFFILLKVRPNAVLSFGGYLSFPVLCCSVLFRVPLFLFEQNSYPGIVNRLFKRWARIVFVNFEYTRRFFKRSLVVGNPLREALKKKVNKKEALKFFNINKKKIILVMGGSQGALAINKVIRESIDKLGDFGIIWITGKTHFQKFNSKKKKGQISILPYLQQMEYAYSLADLAITRAGALSLTELAYFSIPAIMIPLPVSAEDHQLLNARIIENKKAGLVIQEKDLSSRLLLQRIRELFKRKAILQRMKKSMKQLYHKDTTEKVIKTLMREII
ncbi:MAG: undecaprenyldiphospho-muramoylpentapeptide beta-N-acetylglucosaminyltransferase [Spirochaetes bacterium]|nr:undecaprenyldiphospho-muramoylpentapeptide beta-N-acetylglucosaminyltransferase [Spirochaetota bacterium]